MKIPDIDYIKQSYNIIKPFIHRTPVMSSVNINRITDCDILFKCENLQKVGAFKYRGATNAVQRLSDNDAKNGVATHSSGNHAQALALAAKVRGINATIVMPENSPKVKINAVCDYGADIVFCKPTLEARESTLKNIIDDIKCVEIHPYQNFNVIAGQATAALELTEDIPQPDIVMTPVGGGGLLSGTAISVKSLWKGTKVIAAEPRGASDAYKSFVTGKLTPSVNPDTICDGLLTSLGEINFHIIRNFVDEIVLVSDDYIKKAMQLIYERMKIVVEPSGAITLGAMLEYPEKFDGMKIAAIISGGNIDLKKLSDYF
jgi:threonine dehydratase